MTSPSRFFELTTHLSGTVRELERVGIRIEIGDDFAKYRAYRSKLPDRGPIYPMFDVASSYIDHTNGFWICGFNADGALIHTQAVRLLDMPGISLGTHLDNHRHKYSVACIAGVYRHQEIRLSGAIGEQYDKSMASRSCTDTLCVPEHRGNC